MAAGPSDARIQEVLRFWFDERSRECWFRPTPEFDQTIRKHFAELFARAATGELTGWEASAEGCLALCILLDQMPRSMFRGDRRAFVTDDRALAIAERALTKRLDQELTPERKQFLYMPFMHDETLANQLRALALFESQGLKDADTPSSTSRSSVVSVASPIGTPPSDAPPPRPKPSLSGRSNSTTTKCLAPKRRSPTAGL